MLISLSRAALSERLAMAVYEALILRTRGRRVALALRCYAAFAARMHRHGALEFWMIAWETADFQAGYYGSMKAWRDFSPAEACDRRRRHVLLAERAGLVVDALERNGREPALPLQPAAAGSPVPALDEIPF